MCIGGIDERRSMTEVDEASNALIELIPTVWKIQKLMHPISKDVLAQLLSMERKLWKKSDSWESKDLENELRKRKNTCLIASIDQGPGQMVVAYLLFSVNGLALQILKVLVLPQHRRCGIGKALCEEAIRYARESRKCVVGLHVFTENEPAIKLYSQLGFQNNGFIEVRILFIPFL